MSVAFTCEVVGELSLISKIDGVPHFSILASRMDSKQRTKLIPHPSRFGWVHFQSYVSEFPYGYEEVKLVIVGRTLDVENCPGHG